METQYAARSPSCVRGNHPIPFQLDLFLTQTVLTLEHTANNRMEFTSSIKTSILKEI